MARKFIAKAIKHPGELRAFAKSVGCTTTRGTVDLSCVQTHIRDIHDRKKRSHLMRALNLARTLHKLRRLKGR